MDNPEKLAMQGTQDEEKQNKNAICVRHHYAQTNTNVNKTLSLLQTTGGKDELNIVFNAEIVMDITTPDSERKDTKQDNTKN